MKHILFWLLILSCGVSTANEQLQTAVDDLSEKIVSVAYESGGESSGKVVEHAGPYTLMVVYDTNHAQRSYPPVQPVYFSDFTGCNTARKATKIALSRVKILAEIWCTPG